MLKLKLQYFGHLRLRIDPLEKTQMLKKIEGGRRRGRQRMRCLDSINNLINMTFASVGNCWCTGKPGVQKSMGHKDSTERLNWTDGSVGKEMSAMQETQVLSLGWEDPLEKEMVTHSNNPAWKIPSTEKSGRLLSMGLQRVGYDWAANSFLHLTKENTMTQSNYGKMKVWWRKLRFWLRIKSWQLAAI